MNEQHSIDSIYECYQHAMASVGWRVKLPANTDPSKTYAYRAIKKFVEQVREWRLDESITKALVREVVNYGQRNGLLNKGTALLNMKSVIGICHDYLRGELNKTELLITDIRRSKKFMDRQTSTGDVLQILTAKKKHGYANMTQWFRSGELSLGLISVSVNCRRALDMLQPEDRCEFPSDAALLMNRIKILHDPSIREAITGIMGTDLLASGTSAKRG